MTNLKPVDVAIVGGGWTGLAMAKELVTRTSVSVVALERGGPRGLADYAMDMDELDYNIRLRMMQNIAEETITHRHSLKDAAVPVRQYGSFHPGTGVGGAGEHWTGMCFRFLPSVFTLRTHLTEKPGAAKLPPELAVKDWGVTYDQLEPHYWYAERMMGVSGKAGNLRGKLIEGGNIFESPRSHESDAAAQAFVCVAPVRGGHAQAGLSSLSYSRRQPERELYQSGRRLARRLRLLRVLLALRLHDRSEGAAQQHADAGAAQAHRRSGRDARRRSGEPQNLRRRSAQSPGQ